MADSIRCPECRAEIPLTEVISHQIDEELAAKLAREVAVREQAFAVREQELVEEAAARRGAGRDDPRRPRVARRGAGDGAARRTDARARAAPGEAEARRGEGAA